MKKIKKWIKENRFSLILIVSTFIGFTIGLILRAMFNVSPLVLTYIGLPGKVVIRSFMMIIIPLIISSLASSIASTKKEGDSDDKSKRLIIVSFLLIITELIIVVAIGCVFMVIFKPGFRGEAENLNKTEIHGMNVGFKQKMPSPDEAIYDVFMNLVPNNIIGATVMSQVTVLVPVNPENLTLGYNKVTEKVMRANMLGICVFSLVLGYFVLQLGERAHALKTLLRETETVMMQILNSLTRVMPIAIISFMCVEAFKIKSPEAIIVELFSFIGVAFLTFAVIWIVFFPTIYFLFVRKNPFKMYYNVIPAMIMAFSSSSSAATLPTTMKCMEENNKLAQPISHFFLPIGMNLNMPGGAMYFAMVVVFIAQLRGLNLGVHQLIPMGISIIIQVMAVPAAPSGGTILSHFMVVCATLGINDPMELFVYVMTFDWFMDEIRTMTNVMGDCVLSSIVEKLCFIESEESSEGNDLSEVKVS